MLLRLPYLAVFTGIRLLPMSDTDKDIEILILRHQLAILQRQDRQTASDLGRPRRTRRAPSPVPHPRLRRLQLIASPDTILRWYRDLIRRRHAARSRRAIQSLVLRLARENPSWGYRRVHGELITLGVTIAAPTVWEIFNQHGIEPVCGAKTVNTGADLGVHPSGQAAL